MSSREKSIYDSGQMNYDAWGSVEDPTGKFIGEHIEQHIGSLEGKTLIDVGSGQGRFIPLWKHLSARGIQAVDPSKHHVQMSRKIFPDVPVFKGTLAEFHNDEKFDVATAIMVFEHFEDAVEPLRQLKDLVKPGGRVIVVSNALEYTLTPNYYYKMETEQRDDGSIRATVHTPHGTLNDILRPAQAFISAADQVGFSKIEHFDLLANDKLISEAPRYAPYRGMPVRQMLILTV